MLKHDFSNVPIIVYLTFALSFDQKKVSWRFYPSYTNKTQEVARDHAKRHPDESPPIVVTKLRRHFLAVLCEKWANEATKRENYGICGNGYSTNCFYLI